MDTIAMQTEVSLDTWNRIAGPLRRQTLRATPTEEPTTKAYGKLILSRATLYAGRRLDLSSPNRVVLEFSAGRVVRGHNVYGGEVCARMAREFVLDEIEGRSGISLHQALWKVCRLDLAHTFLGTSASPYLLEASGYDLSRRERVVYETGVSFFAGQRSETFYDKRASVEKEWARLRESDDTSLPGLPSRRSALSEAVSLVAGGALRVECRLRGSANVARCLGAEDALFETVVRDASALRVFSAFLTQFDFTATAANEDQAVAALLAAGHTPTRVLQLIGVLALDRSTQFARLGLNAARARALLRDLKHAGVRRIDATPLRPLVLSSEDLAETKIRDEGDLETWATQRRAWRTYWKLPEHESELLAA